MRRIKACYIRKKYLPQWLKQIRMLVQSQHVYYSNENIECPDKDYTRFRYKKLTYRVARIDREVSFRLREWNPYLAEYYKRDEKKDKNLIP